MKLSVSLHDKFPVLHIVVEGELTREDLTGFFEKLTSNEHWRPGIPILDDISGIEVSDIDMSVVRMVADEFKLLEDHFRFTRFAIVTPRALHFGMVRQFIAYTDLHGVVPPQVFKNEHDAINWLLS